MRTRFALSKLCFQSKGHFERTWEISITKKTTYLKELCEVLDFAQLIAFLYLLRSEEWSGD